MFLKVLAFATLAASELLEETLPDDCNGVDESDSCELSLRQLRGDLQTSGDQDNQLGETAVPSDQLGMTPEAISVPDAPNASEVEKDDESGLPGGWGEAAAEVKKHSSEVDYWRGGHWYDAHHRRRYHGHYHPHPHPHPHPAPAPPPYHPGSGAVLTLYHQTGAQAGPLILKYGFKPGSSGWCGGGIYFATSPQATETKAIGPQSHKGFMIQARVNVGRVKYMPKHCSRGLNGGKLHAEGYDSVRFNPGDGDEVIVYEKSRVISVKQIPYHR